MDPKDAMMKSFRAYDYRGIYPEELNEDIAFRVGKAFARYAQSPTILIGMDARAMNPKLFEAAVKGATEEGVNVIDLGLVTSDMFYFASGHLDLPGFAITASHNPPEYSGFKMVRAGAVPVANETGLYEVRDLAIAISPDEKPKDGIKIGEVTKQEIMDEYIEHILSFIDPSVIKPTKLVANTMYGVASNVLKALVKKLPLELITINYEIDGTFPKGPPNPMLPHLRQETADAVKNNEVALGVSWDGDADRVFFWDEDANFIEGYYTGVLLADNLLNRPENKGAKVIHCARLGWLFDGVVKDAGGVSLECKTGHGFIKEMMRKEDAIFAEEMSGHYYFRDNYYADNGMIPFLIVLEMIHKSGKTLGQLVHEYQERMQISGEINYRVEDVKQTVEKIKEHYANKGEMKTLDGVTVEFEDWRFNVRGSNNEPLLRLNVEAKSQKLADEKALELEQLIGGTRAE